MRRHGRMLVALLWLTGLAAAPPDTAAQDHQRIAASLPESHSLSVEAGLSLVDVAGQVVGSGGRLEVAYGFLETFQAALSVPLGTLGRSVAAVLRALGTVSNVRTRLGVGWIVPGGVQASAGASWIQDPVVLAIDGKWHQVEGTVGWDLALTATQVINEAVSWSWGLLPGGQLVSGTPLWTLSLQVQVAWYSGNWAVSSTTTSSNLALSTEAGVGWHHGW